jgi:hypothetical protein
VQVFHSLSVARGAVAELDKKTPAKSASQVTKRLTVTEFENCAEDLAIAGVEGVVESIVNALLMLLIHNFQLDQASQFEF